MPLPEIIVTLKQKPSALEFLLETGDLSKKPLLIEIIAAATENNRGVAPVILTTRKNVESVAGDAEGKFKLKPITVVLDEDFGLKLTNKYCIKVVLYDENRSKLAESPKVITTLAEVPEAPVITAARSKEVGKAELSLRLGMWSGADIRSARVCLFKDVDASELDDIILLDIATTVPSKHATGAAFILDLAPHVVLDAITDYIVKVAFESPIGLGAFSEAFSFKAVDVPDVPLGVMLEHLHLDNTLSVTWKAGADSVQYGDLLKFRVDLSVMPFEGRSEEIAFASVAEKVPLFCGCVNNPKIDLVNLNKHEFVFDRAAQTEFLSQMSVQFPQYTVSRQLKFKAKITASDGMNTSEAAVSSQITVIRLVLTDNYTELFDLTAKGLQTKKESGIERKINFEAKLKFGITYAQIKELLVDPKPLGSVSTPAPWAKGIAFQLDLIQGTSKKSFANSIIVNDTTPEVSTTPMETDIPFSTSDALKLAFWLIDANDNKSYSVVYPVLIPLEVPALVYRPDPSFTVNAGIVSAIVIALSGTKTETLSAKFSLRNYSDVSPNPAQFIETLPLLLEATGRIENEFKISYDPQLLAGASQVAEIKLSVFEKQAGVTTPLQIYSEQSGSRVVISNTNFTDVANSVRFKLFDRTVSPSSPSEYVALMYVEKSVVLQKLKVYNNVEITGRDITIMSSAADKVLTFQDMDLSANKIDVTFSGVNLMGLRVPLASESRFNLDLALLNISSLKETHLFVYLDIQDLRPSPDSVNITAKVNRFIDGQPYKAERVISDVLRDDIGFPEGKIHDFDKSLGLLAFRVNRNGNGEDILFITTWAIPKDGVSINTPEPVFNYVAPNQFIWRNNRLEEWALINLKAGGGPLPYDIDAMLVILNTANRSTSNAFKVLVNDESVDGAIVRELKAIRDRPLFQGSVTPEIVRPISQGLLNIPNCWPFGSDSGC
jgi:hypothetical protein